MMMTREELISTLRLHCIPHIGEISAKKLIAHCGSPAAVFEEKRSILLKIEGIGTKITEYLHNTEYLRAAEKEYVYVNEHKIQTLYFEEEHYPKYLKYCPDSPLLLFTRGNIDLLGKKVLSIVGTRNITPAGQRFCKEFMEELAPLDPVVVSGFAFGVDICIQKAAVDLGLQTIGCLAHGLNQIYPRAHMRYCASIERNGGFITEFWSNSKPERINFLRRNRIIAGISEATIVIESGEKGGSLVTADIANSYNRDVFAVPGRPGDPFSEGTNTLIKRQKAQLLTSVADLVFHLNWDLQRQPAVVQKQLFIDMDETEHSIYSQLQEKGKLMLDDIALGIQLPVFRTASVLLSMELKGLVRPLPGKSFEAI
jgi:DNA processing protein